MLIHVFTFILFNIARADQEAAVGIRSEKPSTKLNFRDSSPFCVVHLVHQSDSIYFAHDNGLLLCITISRPIDVRQSKMIVCVDDIFSLLVITCILA